MPKHQPLWVIMLSTVMMWMIAVIGFGIWSIAIPAMFASAQTAIPLTLIAWIYVLGYPILVLYLLYWTGKRLSLHWLRGTRELNRERADVIGRARERVGSESPKSGRAPAPPVEDSFPVNSPLSGEEAEIYSRRSELQARHDKSWFGLGEAETAELEALNHVIAELEAINERDDRRSAAAIGLTAVAAFVAHIMRQSAEQASYDREMHAADQRRREDQYREDQARQELKSQHMAMRKDAQMREEARAREVWRQESAQRTQDNAARQAALNHHHSLAEVRKRYNR